MYASSNQSTARAFFAVTPSDVTNFPVRARALYVGGDGAVNVVGADGVAVQFSGLVAGTILPVEALRVNATGTTATGVVGLV